MQLEKADSKSSVFILLDLSATFDTVNHQIILSIITGSALHWFESYLTGRSFRVSRGEEVSKEHQLPLGSVLHHIHYIIGTHYTSTWFLLLNSTIDDTQLYHSFQPDNPIVAAWISGCLTNISAWMKEHHQQFNLAKTELLVFPATPTLQHDFAILLGSSKNILWWPADLQGPYCKDNLDQEDQALPNRACWTTSCPDPCHF